jgi:hypothetical protein
LYNIQPVSQAVIDDLSGLHATIVAAVTTLRNALSAVVAPHIGDALLARMALDEYVETSRGLPELSISVTYGALQADLKVLITPWASTTLNNCFAVLAKNTERTGTGQVHKMRDCVSRASMFTAQAGL